MLQPDEEVSTKIEALLEKNSTREARHKHEAEGEEERKMMCSRMGYEVGDLAAKDSDKCWATYSTEELPVKVSKGDFIYMIGPPSSDKMLTMFQVNPADFHVLRCILNSGRESRQSMSMFINID